MALSKFATLRRRALLSLCNGVVGVLTVYSVLRGLPLRHWLADGAALLVCIGFLLATVGLWWPGTRGRLLARVGLGLVLGIGVSTLVLLATSLGALEGVHGPMAAGSRLIVGLVAALVFPYLVVLPAAQLSWLEPSPQRTQPSLAREPVVHPAPLVGPPKPKPEEPSETRSESEPLEEKSTEAQVSPSTEGER